jgi:D-alanine-D-alanine ligase
MSQHPKRVLVLYDLPEAVSEHDDPKYLLNHEDRPTERDVSRAVKKMGFELHVHGIYDDLPSLILRIQTLKPDVIFNLCETYFGDRNHEGDIASLLELSRVAYTGSGPGALHLCKDKGTTKKIVSWDGVRVPEFKMYSRENFRFSPFKSEFPLIVKPLDREASEGISQASVVYDWDSCEERATWVVSKLKSDVIVEEYIHGREIYIGVISSHGTIRALPPRELFFENLDKKEPMIATFRAKWDESYRARWGISTSTAANINKDVLARLSEQSIRIFKSLGLRGYARLDWRLNEAGIPVFLEANPNPALAQDDDFAKAAKSAGYSYTELIADIIEAALAEGVKSSPSSIRMAG